MRPPRRIANRSGSYIPHAERNGRRVDLYLPEDLAKRIDKLRGEYPLSKWLRAAAEVAAEMGLSRPVEEDN